MANAYIVEAVRTAGGCARKGDLSIFTQPISAPRYLMRWLIESGSIPRRSTT